MRDDLTKLPFLSQHIYWEICPDLPSGMQPIISSWRILLCRISGSIPHLFSENVDSTYLTLRPTDEVPQLAHGDTAPRTRAVKSVSGHGFRAHCQKASGEDSGYGLVTSLGHSQGHYRSNHGTQDSGFSHQIVLSPNLVLVSLRTMPDYKRITGLLIIALVITVTVILSLLGWFDIMASIGDIWIWIAAILLGVASNLLTRKIPAKPLEKEATEPESAVSYQAGTTTTTTSRTISREPFGGSLPITLQKNGLEVYTRAEIEQKLPFESFVSQVKRGGELVILAATFVLVGPSKTETIRRLIQEQGVTVTILVLKPLRDQKGLDRIVKLMSDLKRQFLVSDIERTFVALCQLRRELAESEKERFVIRVYDRVPFLSLIVIDPNTEDAVMQIGNYLQGTDPSTRLQIVLSKKGRKDIFDRYWAEYLSIRDEWSSPLDCKEIEQEFLS